MLLVTLVSAEMVTSSATSRWPDPALPPADHHTPAADDGAAGQAAIAAMIVSSPIRQLWATWMRLSSFTPLPITVSSRRRGRWCVGTDLHVVADDDAADLGNLHPVLVGIPRETEPSAPITAPEWIMARAPIISGRRSPRMEERAGRFRRRRRSRSRADDAIVADLTAFTDHRRGRPTPKPAGRRDHRRRMDARAPAAGGLNHCAAAREVAVGSA